MILNDLNCDLEQVELESGVLYISVYEYVNSNMYVIIDEDEAVVIDPHKSVGITDLLKEKEIKSLIILLTHEHHDHTSGIYWYQEHFQAKLICQKDGADRMRSKQYLRPTLLSFIIGEADHINGTHRLDEFRREFDHRQYEADITFEDGMKLGWKGHCIDMFHIPGHSEGSSLIVFDGLYAFTGDSVLKDIPIITRFPGSCHEDYVQKAMPTLKRELKADMMIFPGHGNPFYMKEILKEGGLDVQFR